jgi:hypothetical protein
MAQCAVHIMNQDRSATRKALVYCRTMHYLLRPRLFMPRHRSAAMRTCSDTVQAERGERRNVRKRFSAALIILAAAWLAVPHVPHLGGAHRAFGSADSAELAFGSVPHVLSFRRSAVPPLHLRPSPERQSGLGPIAPVHRLPDLPGHILASLREPPAQLPGKSARHFPLFPTGPPSQG